ncbi:hypothetical protein FLK61_31495 [Paenalkalicoccus suaedae]|uniref:Uncharacterized protein n=1 Tax=Paenalkalicoccus suaedae TaxID=2592382 RepID=A0A859FDS3_9BACI|nr:hypothetical protein [Paenalkalicoccus suaedae]QKS71237.1 hypothetical protein FLK61_31495 [Paenalkalicoccus suaedae]
MKIRHRIVYDKTDINPAFIRFLKDHNANIQEDETDLVVAYIVEKEEEEWTKEFNRLLDKEDLSSIAESIYSKSEMKKAAWYTIRPTYRWEYPQPEDEYVETIYDTTHYCEECGCGLRQKQEFKVKKNPK